MWVEFCSSLHNDDESLGCSSRVRFPATLLPAVPSFHMFCLTEVGGRCFANRVPGCFAFGQDRQIIFWLFYSPSSEDNSLPADEPHILAVPTFFSFITVSSGITWFHQTFHFHTYMSDSKQTYSASRPPTPFMCLIWCHMLPNAPKFITAFQTFVLSCIFLPITHVLLL